MFLLLNLDMDIQYALEIYFAKACDIWLSEETSGG